MRNQFLLELKQNERWRKIIYLKILHLIERRKKWPNATH